MRLTCSTGPNGVRVGFASPVHPRLVTTGVQVGSTPCCPSRPRSLKGGMVPLPRNASPIRPTGAPSHCTAAPPFTYLACTRLLDLNMNRSNSWATASLIRGCSPIKHCSRCTALRTVDVPRTKLLPPRPRTQGASPNPHNTSGYYMNGEAGPIRLHALPAPLTPRPVPQASVERAASRTSTPTHLAAVRGLGSPSLSVTMLKMVVSCCEGQAYHEPRGRDVQCMYDTCANKTPDT